MIIREWVLDNARMRLRAKHRINGDRIIEIFLEVEREDSDCRLYWSVLDQQLLLSAAEYKSRAGYNSDKHLSAKQWLDDTAYEELLRKITEHERDA